MSNLVAVELEIKRIKAAIDAEKADHAKKVKAMESELDSVLRASSLLTSNMDLDRIRRAETILRVRGLFRNAGEGKDSTLQEAIDKICAEDGWVFFKRNYVGTKDYASWHGQGISCQYGYGPSHGSVIFEIGFTESARKMEEFPEADRDACVYYLKNLAAIQAANQSR